ncbi:MAG: cytochrome c nitrite reductase small subunit [Verrucomicrobia bacterium]|nr:cytochrome c nitrite reductase small subunit [Verrucomicrobiota bacterium]
MSSGRGFRALFPGKLDADQTPDDLCVVPQRPAGSLITPVPVPTSVTKTRIILGLILASTLGLFAGVGGYTFYYGQGFSYLSNDPKACVNCHIMREQYDGWQKSPHHAVATCNDCHTPHDLIGKYLTKAENGYNHSKGFTLQDFHEPIMIKPRNATVLQNNCVSCHVQIVDGINTHAGDPKKMLDCVHCHRDVGHGPIH